MSTSIKISLLARLFASDATVREVEVRPFEIKIKSGFWGGQAEYINADSCRITEGAIWRTVEIKNTDGSLKKIGGLSKTGALRLADTIQAQIEQQKQIINELAIKANQLAPFIDWINSCRQGSQWVANRHLEKIRAILEEHQVLLGYPHELYEQSGKAEAFAILTSLAQDLTEFRTSSNRTFCETKPREIAQALGKIGLVPTEEQVSAAISDEDSTLVVASAGSGKTTLLLTKVLYLLSEGLANRESILLLAFNRKAKEKLENDLLDLVGEQFEVHTFHSFGLKILAEASGKKPTLASFVESDNKFALHIDKLVSEVLLNPSFQSLANNFFLEQLTPKKLFHDFQTQGEYFEYVKSVKPISLKGEELKSTEEVLIANALYFWGIEYQYESPYEFDTASQSYRQYSPDFYLPEYGIYIEHFALNELGEPPVYFKNYSAGVEWKRETHKRYQTTLIETYSHEVRSGELKEKLLEKLQTHGVAINPLPPERMFETLKEGGLVTEFGALVRTFIHLFKGRGDTISDLMDRAREIPNNQRAIAFIKLFEPIYDAYANSLREANSIDFDDMIRSATDHLKKTKPSKTFSYLLVDEFQDISYGRSLFLKAIKEHLGIEQLFAVGDDWQAINRFAGGDVSVMTSFEDHFGFTSAFKLTKTFRFNNKVNDVATKFILKNQYQLPKSVKPHRIVNEPQVILVKPELRGAPPIDTLLGELESLAKGSERLTVLVLARYHYLLDDILQVELQEAHPSLHLRFSTVHSAKGQEADHVIVFGLSAGTHGRVGSGFPSEAVDDPLFSLVLASAEDFENAEERRLFYVALTRTKGRVYVIADFYRPSKFFSEIDSEALDVERRGFNGEQSRLCPECETTELVVREGKNGQFLGCKNFPQCNYVASFCASCRTGIFIKDSAQYRCDNPACSHTAETCWKCNSGYMLRREGTYGQFWGCSNFGRTGCSATRNIQSSN